MIEIVFNCPICNKRPILQAFTYNNKQDIIYECCNCQIIGIKNWNVHCMLHSTVLKHEKKLLEMQEIIQLLVTESCPYCNKINGHSSDCIIEKSLHYNPIFLNQTGDYKHV